MKNVRNRFLWTAFISVSCAFVVLLRANDTQSTASIVQSDPSPRLVAAATISLHDVWFDQEKIYVRYSSTLSSCLALHGRNGGLDQRVNFMCTTGTNEEGWTRLSQIGFVPVSGQEVKICNGNNPNECSGFVAIRYAGSAASSAAPSSAPPSSSARSSSAPACNGSECSNGGNAFCAGTYGSNYRCVTTSTIPCFFCERIVTSSAISSVASSVPSSSARSSSSVMPANGITLHDIWIDNDSVFIRYSKTICMYLAGAANNPQPTSGFSCDTDSDITQTRALSSYTVPPAVGQSMRLCIQNAASMCSNYVTVRGATVASSSSVRSSSVSSMRSLSSSSIVSSVPASSARSSSSSAAAYRITLHSAWINGNTAFIRYSTNISSCLRIHNASGELQPATNFPCTAPAGDNITDSRPLSYLQFTQPLAIGQSIKICSGIFCSDFVTIGTADGATSASSSAPQTTLTLHDAVAWNDGTVTIYYSQPSPAYVALHPDADLEPARSRVISGTIGDHGQHKSSRVTLNAAAVVGQRVRLCNVATHNGCSNALYLRSAGTLFINQQTSDTPQRLLIGGEEGLPIMHLITTSMHDTVDITHLQFTADLGDAHSIDHLRLYRDSGYIGSATREGCDGHATPSVYPSTTFCANLADNTLRIVKNMPRTNIYVRPQMKNDASGATSGEKFRLRLLAPTASVKTVRAKALASRGELIVNDGDSATEGEIIVGTSMAQPSMDLTGATNEVTMSGITDIEGYETAGTSQTLPYYGGLFSIGRFNFSAVSWTNPGNGGPNKAILRDIVFDISSNNISFNSTSFYIVDRKNASRTARCIPVYLDGTNIDTYKNPYIYKDFRIACLNLDSTLMLPLPSDLAIMARIGNSRINASQSSRLQVSFSNFDNPAASFGLSGGYNTSHIKWIDSEPARNRILQWISIPRTVVRSTAFRN